MNSEYKIVENGNQNEEDDFSWKYFLRQLLVCSVIWMNFFMFGLCLGGPTVYIPQIRREANSTDAVTDQMASWLTSVYSYSCIPWVIILPAAAAYFGRKLPHVLISVNSLAAFIFFYLSSNVTELLISQIMESVIGAAMTSISILVVTEYTAPKYRGMFLTFKSATLGWGIWVANAMGTFFHWKNIALLKLILSFYPLIVVFFWPESPYWLASKGRLDKCAEAHRWLKGHNKQSEKELERLLNSSKNKDSSSWSLTSIFTKEFIKSTLLGFCVLSLVTFTGKVTCGFYSLDIIKKMTSSESNAYTGMLLMDGFSVLGMYIGSLLSKFFKRRLLFLIASAIGISSLWVLGVYSYLTSSGVIEENAYIALVFLSLYTVGISCGPMIFCTSLFGELLPLRHRSLSMGIVAVWDKILMGTVVKLTPLVMTNLGLHSAFFFFSSISTVSVGLLYKFMPETKDKTLVQIAEDMQGKKKPEAEEKNLRKRDNADNDHQI